MSRIIPEQFLNNFLNREGSTDQLILLLKENNFTSEELGNMLVASTYYKKWELVEVLAKYPHTDINVQNSVALLGVCYHGPLSSIIALLSRPELIVNNQCLLASFNRGHHHVTRALLADGRVDPSYQNNELLRRAASEGIVDIVEILLKDNRVNPSVDNNAPLIAAIVNGKRNIISLLLAHPKIVNPENNNTFLLKLANTFGLRDVVQLFLHSAL